jgi:type IV pilus assembly protein PilO
VKTGLEGKPAYWGLAVGLGIGLFVLFLGYWQKLGPMQEKIEGQKSRLAELQNKIQEGRAAKLQLPQFREQVRNLELELDKLLRILPARRNTPDLLRRIRALAEQGDFSLKRFTPGQLTDKDFYSEWPIAVSVEGTYHNLALFFDRISRFSRIINIENLTITAFFAANSPHTINSNFSAKTFVYKEPTAAPPAVAGAGKPAPPRPAPTGGPPGMNPQKGGGGGE